MKACNSLLQLPAFSSFPSRGKPAKTDPSSMPSPSCPIPGPCSINASPLPHPLHSFPNHPLLAACCCCIASVVSYSVRPHRWQPTRLPRPWDSPGKNTGVGCYFLFQCMKVKVKVKSLSRVRPSATPWTEAFQAPPSMGLSRQVY